MANWYYSVGGRQMGPFPEETLQQMAQTGQLRGQDLVWKALLSRSRQSIESGKGMSERAFWATVRKRAQERAGMRKGRRRGQRGGK